MRDWWRSATLYQVYVRSFADSGGDGVGDLLGIVQRLDYLEWLGVDAVWLNPCFPSPNADWGYDVADYVTADPDLGGDAACDELIAKAGERGIRVLLDLVPNHTSDRHAWFEDARSSRDARHRDWYVWADSGPDGGPPNNWRSVFGGPAWTWDEATGQWYLHNFLPEQPDLNWWSEEVREAFDAILRHWFDRGVAGFRIDVAHGIVKDRALRDNLPVTEDDHPRVRRQGQRAVYSMNRPEVHDVFRRWRRIADAYDPPRVLVGETWVFDLRDLADYYGEGDELNLAFNFPFVHAPFEAEPLADVVRATEEALRRPHAWPVWTLSNHDVVRFPTRWCADNPAKVRCALMLLLTLRGTPVLYYGDELGLPQARLARRDLQDPVGLRHWPQNPGRDGARTPMPWADEPGAGFTAPGVEPWLPLCDVRPYNVAAQREDADSTLALCRELLARRRELAGLREGDYEPVGAPDGVWAYRRGGDLLVAVNLSDLDARVHGVAGELLAGTDRGRTEGARGALELRPWEGVLLRTR